MLTWMLTGMLAWIPVLVLVLLAWPVPAPAQPMLQACSSDGHAVPPRLRERFISADCEACWRSAPPDDGHPASDAVVLDWITPGALADDAPLSAAALRDGLYRLQAIDATRPALPGAQADSGSLQRERAVQRGDTRQPRPRLSIARGPALRGHVGVSIELEPAQGGPWDVWLALVEPLPAGSEGSPVARQLVRGSLQHRFAAHSAASGAELDAASGATGWTERRIMRVRDSADSERLQLVGWVEDARGRMVTLTQTRCAP